MKKVIFLLVLIISASCVFSKNLVYIPTAVSTDGINATFDYDAKDHNNIFSLSGGFNGIEANFTNYNITEYDIDKFLPSSKSIFNAQWQFMPDVGMVPAIAIGARDICCKINKTPAFYLVATKDFSNYIPFDLLKKLSLTGGLSYQSLGVFGGLEAKIGIFYGSAEVYKKDCNFSAGISLFDDHVKLGWKKFNKNNYISGDVGITF